MIRCLALMQRALMVLAVALPLALPTAARAAAVDYNVFFGGQGNLVFDPATSSGAWTGTIDESPFPPVPSPLGLLSVVSFTFNSANNMLAGMFELTSASQFADTLVGRVDGLLTQGSFADGGQLELDYTIENGTGLFAGASGFGISLLDFTALDTGFNSYTEAGVFVFAVPGAFAVPEPSALALAGAALLLLLSTRRKAAPLN